MCIVYLVFLECDSIGTNATRSRPADSVSSASNRSFAGKHYDTTDPHHLHTHTWMVCRRTADGREKTRKRGRVVWFVCVRFLWSSGAERYDTDTGRHGLSGHEKSSVVGGQRAETEYKKNKQNWKRLVLGYFVW